MPARRPPPPSHRTPSRAQQKHAEKTARAAARDPKTRPKKAQTPKVIFVGAPEVEELLLHELGPRAFSLTQGVVALPEVPKDLPDPIFARQVLVSPKHITASTVDELAAGIIAALGDASPRTAFAFAPEMPRQQSAPRPPHALAEYAARLEDTVRQKLSGRREKGKLGAATAHVVQALVTAPGEAYVVVDAVSAGSDPLSAWPGVFGGGRAIDEAARDAPSSAHRKLSEAIAWLAVDVGAADVVVDLGAAPGGWTRVMREYGAKVIAVDRAALDDVIAKDPGVTHLKKDAASVDLAALVPTIVICDVIWGPEHAVAVARRALQEKTLRAAVITLKLKSDVAWDVLADARRLVRDLPADVSGRVKHLGANKREVTLLLRRGVARRA